MQEAPTPAPSAPSDPFAVLTLPPGSPTDPLALSPLASVTPASLTALFEADPSTLSDADLSTLILDLRRRRSAFLSEEAATAAKGKKAKPSRPLDEEGNRLPDKIGDASLRDKPGAEISLDDLTG